jgi:hypothetical protein
MQADDTKAVPATAAANLILDVNIFNAPFLNLSVL